MNNLKLIDKAKEILSNWSPDVSESASSDFFLSLVGLAKIDAEKAINVYVQSLEQWQNKSCQVPLWGFCAEKITTQLIDDRSKKDFQKKVYPAIHKIHQDIYQENDLAEDGLCCTLRQTDDVKTLQQSPLFNTFLTASNASMQKIGETIGANVSDFSNWIELTTHTFNEKLWDEEYGIYNAFNCTEKNVIPLENIDGLLPLFAGIPMIDCALKMLDLLNSEHFSGSIENPTHAFPTLSCSTENFQAKEPHQGAVSIAANWFLWEGTKHYATPEFEEFAEKIKQDSLHLIQQRGFYAHFDPFRNGNSLANLDDHQAVAAAVVLNFLV